MRGHSDADKRYAAPSGLTAAQILAGKDTNRAPDGGTYEGFAARKMSESRKAVLAAVGLQA